MMALGEASTLSDLFLARVRASPHALAYRQHTEQAWIDITWRDAEREVCRWRAALRKEGLKPGDRVALCLRNRVEWVYFDQAALGLGLVVVPLYFNDRPDNMAFCLNDAGARLLLLEDDDLWPALRDQAQTVERVVVLNSASDRDEKVIDVNAWLPREGEALERGKATPDDLATIVYTSGTTGRPKGVMLTHRNIVSNTQACLKVIPINPTDQFLSFLPLSHMFERTIGYYLSMRAGAQTVYARGVSLLSEDIREQRPSVLISVPRIFERIHAGLQAAMPAGSLKRRLFDKAVDIGWKRFNRNAAWHENLLWPLLRLLVADKLRRRFGGRLRLVVVSGAAFAPNLSRVFIGLGLPILQGYGLTETAPALCANRIQDNDPSSVGRALEGVELRCDASGELLARGPNIMRGYWNNPQATAEVIDEEGWFHTGDLARIRDGRVYITGRLKEIIVLSSGEKIPPTDAEQAILVDSVFEQVMVVGEGRAKLGLLVVSRIENEAELCARANKQLHGFPGYARIRHVARLSEPWTVENELLTLTQKLKRKQIEKKFAKEIEAMYQREDLCRNGN